MAHRSRLAGLIIDCRTDDLEAAAAFWRQAFGDARARKPQGKYVKLDSRGGLHLEVQKVAHESRAHLDIASDDIPAEVARLEALGARRVKELRNWTVLEAPTGHRFCVIRARGRDFAKTATLWEGGLGRRPAPPPEAAGLAEGPEAVPAAGPAPAGTHLSRLGGFVIDCRTEDLEAAAGFWSAALGLAPLPGDPGYVRLDFRPGWSVEVQKVAHESRVHLDIASDDVAAEAARLARLGARRIGAVRGWIVMEAPTGQRFCVIEGRSEAFRATARRWDGAAS